MRRFRAKKAGVSISLFPFLAVLICTMGSMIVLLVMVVQMARVDASDQLAQAEVSQPVDKLQMEQATSQWRRDLLEEQLGQVKVDLGNNRLELSHLEQHIRELERRWAALRAEAADIHLRLRGDAKDELAIRDELTRTTEAIEQVKTELETARSAAAQRPPSYSIVPYEGRNGTQRRPIYLECTDQGVVIQPEGIVLTQADFHGSLGPGNPLDATLRAMREYYNRTASGGGRSEPYPLLIVRPGGAESYAVARAALRVWDDEFGYELVDESMKLEYPAKNPQVAELARKAIRDARSRQAALAAAMPSRFQQQDDVGVVASSTRGGFAPLPGSPSRRWATRKGGFGTGGNTAYQDGQAGRPNADDGGSVNVPRPGEQTVGGAAGQGHAGGVPGAEVGAETDACASPLAKERGRNWGLPGETPGATGVTRPLRMACLPDRFILLPDRGTVQTPEVVLIDRDLRAGIDELVSKVWDRIDLWGIAVTGGYWKPVLTIDVAQGAEQRFQDLQTLLIGSGLEVRRRSR